MKTISPTIAAIAIFLAGSALLARGASTSTPSSSAPFDADAVRVTASFDRDWRFMLGDPAGAEAGAFDDASWRTLDVPHDWSIELPFDEHAPTRGSGGFLPAGTGWYRKHFTLPSGQAQLRAFIEFDGVMANSDVWINGHHLGKRPYGYVSFSYELTGHLKFGDGQDNVLVVRADNSPQPASRWYAGAGIYRHVRLVLTAPVHLEHWATFVSTPGLSIPHGESESASAKTATVRVQTSVINESSAARDVALHVVLVDPSGKTVATADTPAQSIASGKSAAFQHEIALANPRLWDLATPDLYRAVVSVRVNGRTLDDETVAFGVRDAHFEADTGFWLNGRNFKLKGVCLHHDGGAFGSAVPLDVWERRLAALRELGVNAIRTAHNPPAPEFLDLCDRMGFLVMDEMFDCWTVAKNPYDYHLYFTEWSKIDTRDTVRRDRNHPSVIIYSAGNEIHDTPKPEIAKPILAGLVEVFHENDPTRPVTQALFRPNVSHDYDNGLADLLDVVGQNYRENEILAAHAQKPTRKILGTENQHGLQVWLALRDNAPYAGQFLWSGIDYIGESRRWPVTTAGSGLLDRAGLTKTRAFERQSWWSEKPMVKIVRRVAPNAAPVTDPGYENPTPQTQAQQQAQQQLRRFAQTLFADWNPSETAPHDENVEIYSNADDVELFLNGKSLGAKPRNADDSPRNWNVAFAPGTLQAVAKNGGKVVATDELRTAGEPAKIILATDHTNIGLGWDDVATVTVSVVDAHGVLVPDANQEISFAISGPGVVAAVDNGDNASHESFQANTRRAFHGRCVAFVKAKDASGAIKVSASAPGLEGATIAIEAAATRP